MARGRPRKAADNLPPHIEVAKIPRGIYWDANGKGRWYVLREGESGPSKLRVAGPDARMSDLFRIAESLQGVDRTSLDWLLQQFHASRQFTELAPRTQHNYEYLARVVKATPTRLGPLGGLAVARMTPAFWQRLTDKLAERTPTQANQMLRYVRRVFRWGVNRDLCRHNPALGVEQAKERRLRRLPSTDAYTRVLRFAQAGAATQARTEGSCAPYLWIAMELAYLLRLRGIEVVTLTDANANAIGVATNRRKGSRDSLVRWTPRLRAAWDSAVDHRERAMRANARPTPLRPEQRQLLVSEAGTPLSKSGLDTAWQRMIRAALVADVIAPEERFAMHDLKRKGVTDTPGTRADKQLASGHKSAQMLDVYDHSLPVVEPPSEG